VNKVIFMRTVLIYFLAFFMIACGDETTQNEGQITSTDTITKSPEPIQAAEKVDTTTYTYPEVEGKEWDVKSFEYGDFKYDKFGDDIPSMLLAGNKVSGFTGCNQYTGEVSIQSDGAISMTNIASTKKLCRDKMTQEQQFITLLSTAKSYSVNSVFMEMECEEGKISFRTTFDASN
jgi:heat shock protein HslJ